MRAARMRAWLEGRDWLVPEDVLVVPEPLGELRDKLVHEGAEGHGLDRRRIGPLPLRDRIAALGDRAPGFVSVPPCVGE
ncbi:hypothetical protein [uncultured Methylobacterium sp.]|uniref:hypothetical protein n=1 Tax=uncultured Methylobacterium sp. TaxID=157278 RepID=UPI0035C9F1EB